jgi:predicted cupin superfamily sugar epimerase
VKIHLFSQTDYSSITLGHSWSQGELVQYAVKKGIVFGAELLEENSTLLSCSVSPGYVDEDFHWPSVSLLRSRFPEQKEIIKRLSF